MTTGFPDLVPSALRAGTPHSEPRQKSGLKQKLEMADSPKEVAEKALEAARLAAETARIAKSAAEHILTEIRERLDRQDGDAKEFRDWLRDHTIESDRKFDAFKSDFNEMDMRCQGHDFEIYGDRNKNKVGVIQKVDEHDTRISKALWTIGLIGSLGTMFWG